MAKNDKVSYIVAMKLKRLNNFVYLMLAITLLWGGTSRAEVLVELFTAQGCSSCTIADEYLAELDNKEDVLPLSYHINYWDYLGWPDGFAKEEFTLRQVGYQKRNQSKQLYTPQFVVGGSFSFAGDDMPSVNAAISQLVSVDDITYSQKDNRLTLMPADDAMNEISEYEVWLLQVSPNETVEITAGENAGKTVTYVNVVRSIKNLGMWRSDSNFETKIDRIPSLDTVVLLQAPNFGVVKWAKKIRF